MFDTIHFRYSDENLIEEKVKNWVLWFYSLFIIEELITAEEDIARELPKNQYSFGTCP
jgi:hypothetical protein